MVEIRGSVRLRPTRVGFLVSPSDKRAVRKIMRINATLWGGQYNPIIPVFQRTPKDWVENYGSTLKGRDVTAGYVRFFEPDVYVEASEGLLEKSGLGAFRGVRFDRKVLTLSEFFDKEHRGIHEPAFGQSVYDILHETYLTERRFQLRDELPAIYPQTSDAFSESCVGLYPDDENTSYFENVYRDVYQPESTASSPDTWLKIFNEECVTPFSVTNKHFETWRSWNDEPVIYVFDPSKSTDLIDLWNLRIQPAPIFPVPIAWLNELAVPLNRFVEKHHRPLKGNQNGVMHRTTIEKSRSISEEQCQDEILSQFSELPPGSLSYKAWRTSIWSVNYGDAFVVQPERIKLTAETADQVLVVKSEGGGNGDFETLAPNFSQQYSASKNRWANVLTLASPYQGVPVALSLPYNTFDRSWPFSHYGEFSNGREGWTYLQDYKSIGGTVSFFTHEDAFSSWFKRIGIDVNLSEAGRIAKQVIDSLGGFWGLFLVDDINAIQFINKLSMSTRRREKDLGGNVVEEDFSGRSASIDEWQAMLKKRKANGAHHLVDLSSYIEKNVIRIGVESECDHCVGKNWHALDELDYEVKCSRCLKVYKFPQGKLKKNNQNWRYRVIGPFAVPDYAQGAYASLLTIRFFTRFRDQDALCSYSTALDLEKGGQRAEIDFAIWVSDESGHDAFGEPSLLIGEAKSFGDEVLKDKDFDQLKKSAGLVPGSVIVISVLKEGFSEDELERLREFILWAREPVNYKPKHLVILLTGTELFDQFLESTWRDKGKPYSDYADYNHTRSFAALSDATQAIYLGFKPYYQWLDEKMNNEK